MMRYRMIDLLRGTRVTTVYNRFNTNPYTAESLQSFQRQKLAELLVSIRMSNPYFAMLLHDRPESEIRSNPENVLKSLPLMDKPLIAANRGTLFRPVPGRPWQAKRTGGSTGEPFHYHVDLDTISEMIGFHFWNWRVHSGYRLGNPYLTVAGQSLEAMGDRLKITIYHFLGNNYQISGDLISDQMPVNVRKIRKAYLLYGYPSSIFALLEKNPSLFDDHQLRAVFTTSEQLLPTVRDFIQNRLGAPIFDIYGAYDGGILSCECSEHQGYHYNPLNCYVETFENETGQNELLLTSLNTHCLPMVRYRVGDVAILGDFGSCPCGSPFPMIRNLLGRTRDLIRLKSGEAVHGSKFNKVMYGFPAVRRYRIVQADDYRVTIHLDVNNFSAWSHSEQKKNLELKIGTILAGTDFAIEALTETHAGNDKFKVIESRVA